MKAGALIGRSYSPATDWAQRSERERWIGKPWRRFHLLTARDYYQGEEVGHSHDLTLHLGLRRLGLYFTLSFGKTDVLDYSDEEHQ